MPLHLYDEQVMGTFRNVLPSRSVQVPVEGLAEARTITKPFPSPIDWRDHWIYFLMVDRFNNPVNKPVSQWDAYAGGRQGGTFEGIRRKLGYIRDLGAEALWLTPVLKNRQSDGSHHGYGIMDFLEVDPRFGSAPEHAESEFIRLVDEAHARGLYVILDIVLNHAGDIFAYNVDGHLRDSQPWCDTCYDVRWRDETGAARAEWPCVPGDRQVSKDAVIWPKDLQNNDWFRRKGEGGPVQGDFSTLKEFVTGYCDSYQDKPVLNMLIRAHQYLIAKFDVDGFRVDTLKHIERESGLSFCNAVREFAYSIGKKNFFIFGEVKDQQEGLLAEYTGRYTKDDDERVGADAALDFPLCSRLGSAAKGFSSPLEVSSVFETRKNVQKEKGLLSTHGEASRFFVTFLECHDDCSRFLYPRDGGDYTDQLTMALGCLFGLQGIPCLYYGCEQGLRGTQDIYRAEYDGNGKPEYVREALWGKDNAFDQNSTLYREIRRIAEIRAAYPALRYGRQYFRPVSGNNADFGLSKDPGGVIAFSRILNDREVVVVANTSVRNWNQLWVAVDPRINTESAQYVVIYSNKGTQGRGGLTSGYARFYTPNGEASDGWARRLYVNLAPMEIQILTRQE